MVVPSSVGTSIAIVDFEIREDASSITGPNNDSTSPLIQDRLFFWHDRGPTTALKSTNSGLEMAQVRHKSSCRFQPNRAAMQPARRQQDLVGPAGLEPATKGL